MCGGDAAFLSNYYGHLFLVVGEENIAINANCMGKGRSSKETKMELFSTAQRIIVY